MKIETPDDLYKLRAEVAKDLNEQLLMTKHLYASEYGFNTLAVYPYRDMLDLRSSNTEFVMPSGEVDVSLLQDIINHKEPVKMVSPSLDNYGRTEVIGRTDYYTESSLRYEYYIPLETITDEMVQIRTKQKLTQLVMPENETEYTFSLDCKLLEQFKLGRMSMDNVVEYSKGACEL